MFDSVVLFQGLILICVVFKYISHFLKAYFFSTPILFLDVTTIISEVIYGLDVIVHLLHAFWPLVRVHMRVYRRNLVFLIYDAITVFPFTYACKFSQKF